MIKVAVAGCLGRMGTAVVNAVQAQDDMELACGIDPNAKLSEEMGYPIFETVEQALSNVDADVMVDFTQPDAAAGNIAEALSHAVDCVVGTTGLSESDLEGLAAKAPQGTCLFYAPNFTTGAVLMMQFARMASMYFPQVEVIEYHHCNKKDSPSGTAVTTAKLISEARNGLPSEAPGSETEISGYEGARGTVVNGIPVHSVRSMGFVANQQVIFGSMGQTLTITHESWDRESYMPGVMLAIRSVIGKSGLIVGLESFMAGLS